MKEIKAEDIKPGMIIITRVKESTYPYTVKGKVIEVTDNYLKIENHTNSIDYEPGESIICKCHMFATDQVTIDFLTARNGKTIKYEPYVETTQDTVWERIKRGWNKVFGN